jgi:putative hydrolase of the HAD superfamily
MMIEAVICDLDDTLFDESTYVASGLRVVARHMASRYEANADGLYNVMRTDMVRNGRGTAFNAALRAVGQPDEPLQVDALVNLYRQHVPMITLYPDATRFLEELPKENPHIKTSLVTDGLPVMQRNKVAALGIAGRFNTIVCCGDLAAPKPAVAGFLQAAHSLGVELSACAMIGDRVDHDMAPAKALGMHTIRLARGRYAHLPSSTGQVDATFTSLDGVLDYLRPLLKKS